MTIVLQNCCPKYPIKAFLVLGFSVLHENLRLKQFEGVDWHKILQSGKFEGADF